MHAAESDAGCSELPPDEPSPPLSGEELAFSLRPVGGGVNDDNPCICLSQCCLTFRVLDEGLMQQSTCCA